MAMIVVEFRLITNNNISL